MTVVSVRDDRKRLFENLFLLTRAAREQPSNRDLAAVRADLEDQLGPTVSLRLASELLGVSHTSLRRWIANGDLSTVFTPHGRIEIPVGVLLDLRESVDDARNKGARRRHVLEPSMMAARERAAALRPELLVADAANGPGHRPAELRSLAYHRAIARRLRRSEVEEARQTIWKWRAQGRIDPYYADEWERLLAEPVAEVRRALSEDSPQMRDLRQSSPFAGMLSEAERRRALQAVR